MAMKKDSFVPVDQITVLGVRVHPIDIQGLNAAIRQAVGEEKCITIGGQNLHGVVLYHKDARRRAYLDQVDIVRIDGMAILLWARLLGYPVRREHRVTYVDWVYPLMATAEAEGWRVFYLGGKPGVVAKGAGHLQQHYPRLIIQTRHGYFGPEENHAVLEEIAGSAFKRTPF